MPPPCPLLLKKQTAHRVMVLSFVIY